MIYAAVVRQRPEGVFGIFDCPDGGQIAPRRNSSTTPLQALNLMNSGFVLQAAAAFATRLEGESHARASTSAEDLLRRRAVRAFELAFQREPEPDEVAHSTAFIHEHGLKLFCRMLFNANEFSWVF